MWRSREEEVTCIACGRALPRSEAREYDKHGDRWNRRGKEFEYLCKACHGELCHQPRDGLEATLIAVADEQPGDQEAFAAAYARRVSDEPTDASDPERSDTRSDRHDERE